eukprot:TRINITY_DN832_c0_g3_i1.p1 TRINITY_DN832_c0_g3~~TRINITY_DN832_c0_g3_i1.p1  ORF type:complete len:625 (+),score=247.15 TRINITY_DN832_c0_g3_i1:82-1956(+)
MGCGASKKQEQGKKEDVTGEEAHGGNKDSKIILKEQGELAKALDKGSSLQDATSTKTKDIHGTEVDDHCKALLQSRLDLFTATDAAQQAATNALRDSLLPLLQDICDHEAVFPTYAKKEKDAHHVLTKSKDALQKASQKSDFDKHKVKLESDVDSKQAAYDSSHSLLVKKRAEMNVLKVETTKKIAAWFIDTQNAQSEAALKAVEVATAAASAEAPTLAQPTELTHKTYDVWSKQFKSCAAADKAFAHEHSHISKVIDKVRAAWAKWTDTQEEPRVLALGRSLCEELTKAGTAYNNANATFAEIEKHFTELSTRCDAASIVCKSTEAAVDKRQSQAAAIDKAKAKPDWDTKKVAMEADLEQLTADEESCVKRQGEGDKEYVEFKYKTFAEILQISADAAKQVQRQLQESAATIKAVVDGLDPSSESLAPPDVEARTGDTPKPTDDDKDAAGAGAAASGQAEEEKKEEEKKEEEKEEEEQKEEDSAAAAGAAAGAGDSKDDDAAAKEKASKENEERMKKNLASLENEERMKKNLASLENEEKMQANLERLKAEEQGGAGAAAPAGDNKDDEAAAKEKASKENEERMKQNLASLENEEKMRANLERLKAEEESNAKTESGDAAATE